MFLKNGPDGRKEYEIALRAVNKILAACQGGEPDISNRSSKAQATDGASLGLQMGQQGKGYWA